MSMHEHFDAAIAGGGVGGLTLAVQLAGAGKRVILFERNVYPFHKVCGEYISMESKPFLERIGFPFGEFTLPHMTELLVTAPSGTGMRQQLDIGGFGISRYLLDKTLAELARSKGAVIRDGTKVTDVQPAGELTEIVAGSERFMARVVCGTYGKQSNLAGRAKKSGKNYVAVKYHLRTAFDPAFVELHNFSHGYCGMSPIENGLTNFTYLSDSENLRANGNDIRRMEENVLKKNPRLRFYLGNSENILGEPLVISNVTFSKRTTIERGMLLAGDAAGTIAPLCGNGMSMAMNASAVLAPLLLRFLDGKTGRETLEREYTKEWNRLFGRRITAGRAIQHFFGNAFLTETAIRTAKLFPFIGRSLLKLTHGKSF